MNYFFATLSLTGILIASASIAQHDHSTHDHTAGDHQIATLTSTEETLQLPNFPVTSAQGIQGGLRDMLPQNAPVILSFTYTGCESLCDITNAILLGADEDLSREGLLDARIVTLTIDPQNDTPEQLLKVSAELGSSDKWLWLTGGIRGTQSILSALRFPPGAVEEHDPVFLVGRPCAGTFIRVVGLANPEDLVHLAANLPECEA